MKRHRFDPLSLVFGLLYAFLGARFLMGPVSITEVGFGWIWPVVAVAIGLALLASARRPDYPAGKTQEATVEERDARPPDQSSSSE